MNSLICFKLPSLKRIAMMKIISRACLHPELIEEMDTIFPLLQQQQDYNVVFDESCPGTRNFVQGLHLPPSIQMELVRAMTPCVLHFAEWCKWLYAMILIPCRLHGESSEFKMGEKSLIWTYEGTIDTQRTLRMLADDEKCGSTIQNFCRYFLEKDWFVAWRMTVEEGSNDWFMLNAVPYLWENPMVESNTFQESWNQYLAFKEKLLHFGNMDDFWERALEVSVYCGNEDGVKFSWLHLKPERREKIRAETILLTLGTSQTMRLARNSANNKCFPTDSYMRIIVYFLTQMNDSEIINLLKKDIQRLHFRSSLMLAHCLHWPYEHLFMQFFRNYGWDFLPDKAFLNLLRIVAQKTETNLLSRDIFTDFWVECPDRLKRFFFASIAEDEADKKIVWTQGNIVCKENIIMLLSNATEEEKRNVVLCFGLDICKTLLEQKQLDSLECFFEETNVWDWHQENTRLCRLLPTLPMIRVLMQFFLEWIGDRDYTAAEKLIPWIRAPYNDIESLHEHVEDLIRKRFLSLILATDWDTALNFLTWCWLKEKTVDEVEKNLPKLEKDKKMNVCRRLLERGEWMTLKKMIAYYSFPDTIDDFKRELVSSSEPESLLQFLVDDERENVENFLQLCQCLEPEKLADYKKRVAYGFFDFLCVKIRHGSVIKLKQQETLQDFLRDCLPKKEDVIGFQKSLRTKVDRYGFSSFYGFSCLQDEKIVHSSEAPDLPMTNRSIIPMLINVVGELLAEHRRKEEFNCECECQIAENE